MVLETVLKLEKRKRESTRLAAGVPLSNEVLLATPRRAGKR
jgi:hypothetical protein